MNLAELLDGLPDVAVYTLGADVSRGDLVASAARLGMTLAESGLSTGQVVAAMLPNDAITIAALFGTWRAGGVYTPLNPRAADAELITQLDTLRPVAVITTPDLADRFSTFGLPVIAGAGSVMVGNPVAHHTREPAAVRRRRRAAAIHLGHHRSTEARATSPRHGARPDRPAARQAARCQIRWQQVESDTDAQPGAAIAVAMGRDLPGAVRVPRGFRRGADGPIRTVRFRRARQTTSVAVHRACHRPH